PFFVRSIDVLADRHGFARISPNEAESMRGQSARQILSRVGLPLWKIPRLARDFTSLMGEHLDEIRVFPGMAETLQLLHAAGVVLAVVTSNAERNVRRVLGAQAALVQTLECGVSLFGKRARLKKVLRTTRVAASSALYVGDEIRDAEAARGANMAFGAVAWGYATAAALRAQNPHEFFETPTAIAGLVRSNAR
ncbi:MAG TPA: HAD hydrolase-like protein, partial [Polyangia bacterium]